MSKLKKLIKDSSNLDLLLALGVSIAGIVFGIGIFIGQAFQSEPSASAIKTSLIMIVISAVVTCILGEIIKKQKGHVK